MIIRHSINAGQPLSETFRYELRISDWFRINLRAIILDSLKIRHIIIGPCFTPVGDGVHRELPTGLMTPALSELISCF